MSYIWDDAGRSWRPVREGEAGEFYWDGTSWVPNPIGGDFVWGGTATGWTPGPGGTHEWVQAERSWRPKSAAAGGEHFWNGTAWELRPAVPFDALSLSFNQPESSQYLALRTIGVG